MSDSSSTSASSTGFADFSIGLFDSGLGGLTVLKELKKVLPSEKFIYLGDTARTPYGSKGKETIIRYSAECSDFLFKHQIKILVVACNTASSFALEELRKKANCPVIGTIEQAVKLAVETTANMRIGVIGTEATISSAVYEDNIKAVDKSISVFSRSCPLFVPLVEQGMFSGEIVDKIVELYLAPLKAESIDTLVLGCTHYPLLISAIKKFMGENLKIVECSKAIALEVGNILTERNLLRAASGKGDSRYFATDGVERFSLLARHFLEEDSVHADKIEIN